MDAQNTEQRILEAAEREFLTKGFSGARTTAIAEAAGVTHAMLHYYFRSKEKLFEMIVKDKMGLLAEMLLASMAPQGKSLMARIDEVIGKHLDFLAANPDLPRFFIVELYSQSERMQYLSSAIREKLRSVIDMLQIEIDAAASRGECRRVDAAMLILNIVSLNIFSFVAPPMIVNVLYEHWGGREQFIEARKKENIDTIMRKLKP